MNADDRIDAHAEIIPGDDPRATLAAEKQRDIDARMAAAFSTSTEHAQFDIADVRRLYRGAI